MQPSGALTLPGQKTLVAAWRALAETSPRAAVVESANAVIATFPSFGPMNNAIVLRQKEVNLREVAAQVDKAFACADVKSWALWIPNRATTFGVNDEVDAIGDLKRDTTNLVMKANIESMRGCRHASVRPASITAACRAGDEPIPTDELAEGDPDASLAGWVMVDGDVAVAGAYRFLFGSDCGIYAVGTAPAWRRRGMARGLVEHMLAEAASKGARTATLQSTPAGQHLYESLGFAPVGRYEEWTPNDA